MKKLIILLFLILYSLFTPRIIFAEYVLPYPSYMPGNTMYRVSRILDSLKYYWFRGNIAQTKYHLALSDKYLVEAKTLFEYKQYLLGKDALTRSDGEIQRISLSLDSGMREHEDMSGQLKVLCSALPVHNTVLLRLLDNLPKTYVWKDENKEPVSLDLASHVQRSIDIRTALFTKYACPQ